MITINDFLGIVLDDFKKYVDSADKLCELKEAHFDGGRIPDYSDPHIQQLYLLRYAYAYAFEYKVMYRGLKQRIKPGSNIKVTSIGCGNLIDYWSLARIVGNNCRICYRGIDTVDWAYRFPERDYDDVKCIIGNVLDLFQGASSFSSDVYIFPKSISEFTSENVHTLANCFTSNTILKDTVHFLFSLRTDSGSKKRDGAKTSIIYDRMIQCGFHTKDQRKKYYHFNDSISGRKIREVDDDFCHPGEVIDCLKELYAECSDFQDCANKEDCINRLSRWPILKCNQAAWQIFTFER